MTNYFNIKGKAEFMNPGGSVKDRAALYMIDNARRSGAIKEGGEIKMIEI